jgi:hypothetical protein
MVLIDSLEISANPLKVELSKKLDKPAQVEQQSMLLARLVAGGEP